MVSQLYLYVMDLNSRNSTPPKYPEPLSLRVANEGWSHSWIDKILAKWILLGSAAITAFEIFDLLR